MLFLATLQLTCISIQSLLFPTASSFTSNCKSQSDCAQFAPGTRELFITIAGFGKSSCNRFWVSYLRCNRKIQDFEKLGGTIRHASEDQFLPSYEFQNLWRVSCVCPQFCGSESDLECVIRELDVTELRVICTPHNPFSGKFLTALDDDHLTAVELENVTLDRHSLRSLADSGDDLVKLNVTCAGVSDESMFELEPCHNLEDFAVTSDLVTDRSLEVVLNGKRNLKCIAISAKKVDGRFLSIIDSPLFMLRMDDCKIENDPLKEMHRFASLEVLSLRNSVGINDTGVKAIVEARSLRAVDLTGTQIGSEGLNSLATLEELDTLVLEQCSELDDQCIDALIKFSDLYRLSVYGTQITSSGIDRLRLAMPDCSIAGTAAERWTNPFTGSVLDLN